MSRNPSLLTLIHLVSYTLACRKPLFTRSNAYALGPVLRVNSSPEKRFRADTWRCSEPLSSGHKAVLRQDALPLVAEYKINPLLRQVRVSGLFCGGYRIGSRDVQVLWYFYDLD